jgi:hypothetical protein
MSHQLIGSLGRRIQADRMVDRLSLIQLNKLSGLKKLRGQDMRKITVEDFLKRTRSLQDP